MLIIIKYEMSKTKSLYNKMKKSLLSLIDLDI